MVEHAFILSTWETYSDYSGQPGTHTQNPYLQKLFLEMHETLINKIEGRMGNQ